MSSTIRIVHNESHSEPAGEQLYRTLPIAQNFAEHSAEASEYPVLQTIQPHHDIGVMGTTVIHAMDYALHVKMQP
jgi:hypothetical protein